VTWRMIAVIYILPLPSRHGHEAWSPANTGWIPSYSAARVAGVSRGRPTAVRMIRNGSLKLFKLPKCRGKGKNKIHSVAQSSVDRLIG
jgi:hypothetical protein